jgi:hypothetical protein
MANKNQLRPILLLSALLCFMASSAAFAQRNDLPAGVTLPAYYPADYQQTGIIRKVQGSGTLIINGQRYYLDAGAKIHTTASQFANSLALKTGEEVGFNYVTDATNKRNINEIWVFPKGTVALH